ncbi:ankyrin repeat and zinc finger domain-containing protein 1 [Ixodes scapularis]
MKNRVAAPPRTRRIMSETSEGPATNNKNPKKSCVPSNFFTWQLTDPLKVERYLIGLSLANCTPQLEQELYAPSDVGFDEKPIPETDDLKVSTVMCCSLCGTEFESRDDQVQHYKADWHRYNLKQKLNGEAILPEQEFLDMIEEVSSISGSESETDTTSATDTPESASGGESSPLRKLREGSQRGSSTRRAKPGRERSNSVASTDTEGEDTDPDKSESRSARMNAKVYLKNSEGQVMALYRCIVHGKLAMPATFSQLISAIIEVPKKMQWAILMVGGGHFAAAVFNGSESLLHKTFHRYTVRAKQGGAQSSRDGKQKGMQPKSAGASLRRHNEIALTKDIQDLLGTWAEELQKCSAIFYRAPGANRIVLFYGKSPPFKKSDPRLRPIPFPTNRATYKEVLRVQRLLSTVECFGSEADLKGCIPVSPKVHLGSKKVEKASDKPDIPPPEDALLSRLRDVSINESSNGVLPPSNDSEDGQPKDDQGSDSDSDATVNWEISEEAQDLREFECTRKPRKRRHKKKKDTKEREHTEKPVPREFRALKTALFESCKAGNGEALASMLRILADNKHGEQTDASSLEVPAANEPSENDAELPPPRPPSKPTNLEELAVVKTGNQFRLLSPVGSDPDATPVVERAVEWGARTEVKLERQDSGESPSVEMCCDVVRRLGLEHRLLNGPIDSSDSTLLHYCAKHAAVKLIRCLMQAGADPVVQNAKGQTPYMVCPDKQTRNEFRRFRAGNPDMYDYEKAQIPSGLTDEMEKERSEKHAEKQREKRKLHREKLKERKAAEVKRKEEEQEKQRFLSLSDRDKRALAAERRFAKQLLATNASHVVLVRCFMCGIDITGKVPFEYSSNKFCTIDCVKEHRKKPSSRT